MRVGTLLYAGGVASFGGWGLEVGGDSQEGAPLWEAFEADEECVEGVGVVGACFEG